MPPSPDRGWVITSSIFIKDIFIWNNDNNSSHNFANKPDSSRVSVPTNYQGGISQWPDRGDRLFRNIKRTSQFIENMIWVFYRVCAGPGKASHHREQKARVAVVVVLTVLMRDPSPDWAPGQGQAQEHQRGSPSPAMCGFPLIIEMWIIAKHRAPAGWARRPALCFAVFWEQGIRRGRG